ncbi:DUF397 domain-containing protein [Streptomyces hydrogenans]|uniref:DUF397 domain-containing protein n=1 Tax=Streptomyces hydrogenans TaxID=1873719 RepID=UPI003808B796
MRPVTARQLSKNPTGPVVTMDADAWAAFLERPSPAPEGWVRRTWSRGIENGHG